MGLQEYRRKRDFKKTIEPRGGKRKKSEERIFVIHEHHASHLHCDLRLEMNGVLKSWAVPKGLSLDPSVNRLAVQVEDHPMDYAGFEGSIPKGEYGGGDVYVFDSGYWQEKRVPNKSGLKKGRIEFYLYGKKYRGLFILVRSGKNPKNWFVKKVKDEFAIPNAEVFFREGKDPMPSYVPPQLAIQSGEVPTGDWAYEIKYDGYRTQVHLAGDDVRYYSRNGLDWTSKYAAQFNESILAFPTYSAVVDGEVAHIDENGKSDFGLLQRALKNKNLESLRFIAFDLLYLHGRDLRKTPLLERKELLRTLCQNAGESKIIYADYLLKKGSEFLKASCQYGLEGIVAKKSNSLYLSERSSDWVKVKCQNNEEFVIVGYVLRTGSFTSLLLGQNVDGKLKYIGRVGTGFTQKSAREALKKLKPLRINDAAVKVPLAMSKDEICFVKPELYAQVHYQSWSANGNLLKASFKGLREDKKYIEPKEENFEAKLTHPEKILFKNKKITKKELADYYHLAAPRMLALLANKPLSVLRCPEGIEGNCFFQKNFTAKEVKYIGLTKASDGVKTKDFFYIDQLPSLLELIQLNAIELHAMGAKIPDVSLVDSIVMDFDPSPGVKWTEIKKVVLSLKEILDQLGLKSFIKSTGGKGVHVHIPIRPIYAWDVAKEVSKAFAKSLEEKWPKLVTAKLSKSARGRKIFVDYLRNARGATSVAPYSVRARPEAGVAMPLSWEEFLKSRSLVSVDIRKASKILKSSKADPWADYEKFKNQEISFISKV